MFRLIMGARYSVILLLAARCFLLEVFPHVAHLPSCVVYDSKRRRVLPACFDTLRRAKFPSRVSIKLTVGVGIAHFPSLDPPLGEKGRGPQSSLCFVGWFRLASGSGSSPGIVSEFELRFCCSEPTRTDSLTASLPNVWRQICHAEARGRRRGGEGRPRGV